MDKATVVTYPDRFAREEVVELAKAAGYEVVQIMIQKRIVKSEYGVGVGKADELREMVSGNGSNTVIIDESISSSQANKLALVCAAEIVDRERLILNIFARRAVTTEAKLQVQLAELKYEMPRAKDAVRYSANGERAGFSGMGETAVDVKFRALKARMSMIKQKLAKAESRRELHLNERKKLDVPLVSLAGYTSSGKTTLFNRLASEKKEESPKLFTTLTTTTRMVTLGEANRRVMLSDTVGFISRLPTYLVESFKSTLDELTYADLVLLMLDASERPESMRIKLESCREILSELQVDIHKVLLVLNKTDMARGLELRQAEIDGMFEGFSPVRISAIEGDGMHKLRTRIKELVFAPKQIPRAA